MSSSPSSAHEWIAEVPLIDHHCHGVLDTAVDQAGLEDLITESDRPAGPGLSFFDTQLGFALRRHCAPVLDLAPFASPEDYVARRQELGVAEVNSRLLRAQPYDTLLIETGHLGDIILGPAEMATAGDCRAAEVVRLERVAEEIVEAGCETRDFRAAFSEVLADRLRTAVGAKSIAAYRIGLDFEPSRPDAWDVDDAVAGWLAESSGGRPVRLADPVIIRHLLWVAVDAGVPLQFHIGYGDPDVDLHRCNPLLLTEFLRLTRDTGVRVMLLHCYPFHREAGYLAHCFAHVYCDVGLAVNYTGAQSGQIIAESLELTPFHKALFSSDAWGAPELFHLGALLFRRGLADALDTWAGRDGWPVDEQRRITELICHGNAARVYGLDPAGESR